MSGIACLRYLLAKRRVGARVCNIFVLIAKLPCGLLPIEGKLASPGPTPLADIITVFNVIGTFK